MKLFRTLYLAAAFAFASTGLLFAQHTPYFMHTITKGQSLYSISCMYNVTVDEIIKLNPGSEKSIRLGQTLKIPQHANRVGTTFHTIQAGETLYQLTVKYGVTAQRICQANPGLSAKNFRVGQVVAIPATTPTATVATPVQTVQPVQQEQKKEEVKQTPKWRDMHKVKRRETLYKISKEYGITEEELLAANPEIQGQKLKKGTFLRIPYPKVKEEKKPRPEQLPLPDPMPVSNDELFKSLEKDTEKMKVVKAAVVLPFMTQSPDKKDEQGRMVEYYEGVLMAVDSLKRTGVSIDLYAYDSGATVASVNRLLQKPEMKEMNVIFGPAHTNQVAPMANFAQKHHIRLVVPFTSKGGKVFENPSVFQVNTPQSYLYSEVYDHFHRKFGDTRVIFLNSDNRATDKLDFISGLKDELDRKHVKYHELQSFEINPDTLKLNMDSLSHNLFIPTSGKNIDLIKILPQLVVTRRANPDWKMTLFGYPEWQTYTDDHLASFYEMDTYFYSSFYTNNLFPEAIRFGAAYRKWFSKDMANTFPRYGMLGFDTAFFFLKNLALYGDEMEEKMNELDITPIQTGFKFVRVNNWGGFVNRKVFFVHFTPNYELIKLDFE